ncbi:MAG: class I adenylate-forming enzyme family protein [Pseudomonadota bacterium]
MRLEAALDAAAARRGEHPALVLANGDSLSFAQLATRSRQFASQLIATGIHAGDRVAIVSRHDLDALTLFWAVLRVGGIVVWLNDDARASDLPDVLHNSDPAAVFVQTDKQRKLFDATPAYASRVRPLADLATTASHDSAALPELTDEDAPAAIVYTSGSSGRPKGVCLSHKNILTVDHAVVSHMPIGEDDSYMMVVPMHYVHGLMQLTVHAVAGATVHFFDNFLFPKKVIQALQTTRVRGFSGVPFHFNALITRGGLLDSELPDLRWVTVTGGKLAADTILKVIEHFPALEFHIAYGQSECAPRATALHPSRTATKPDSVGRPIPGVQVLLLSEDDEPVARGEVGEVVIAGDNIMLGYWNDPDATALALDAQGRLRTGDLGRFDDDGDLFLVGRRSAMIKSAGERIIPEELERALMACDGVDEAVVVGVDDALLGQRVVAHVTLGDHAYDDNDAATAAIRAHMSQAVALARVPREYHVWDEFPRKANGKPDRVALAITKADA